MMSLPLWWTEAQEKPGGSWLKNRQIRLYIQTKLQAQISLESLCCVEILKNISTFGLILLWGDNPQTGNDKIKERLEDKKEVFPVKSLWSHREPDRTPINNDSKIRKENICESFPTCGPAHVRRVCFLCVFVAIKINICLFLVMLSFNGWDEHKWHDQTLRNANTVWLITSGPLSDFIRIILIMMNLDFQTTVISCFCQEPFYSLDDVIMCKENISTQKPKFGFISLTFFLLNEDLRVTGICLTSEQTDTLLVNCLFYFFTPF